MLHDVCLYELSRTCLMYATARTGLGRDCTAEKLEQTTTILPIPENLTEIPVGAIVFWENTEGEKSWRLTLKNHTVIETYTYNRGHYAIYEGGGLISDLSWQDDSPYIRFRKLAELSRPDKMYII